MFSRQEKKTCWRWLWCIPLSGLSFTNRLMELLNGTSPLRSLIAEPQVDICTLHISLSYFTDGGIARFFVLLRKRRQITLTVSRIFLIKNFHNCVILLSSPASNLTVHWGIFMTLVLHGLYSKLDLFPKICIDFYDTHWIHQFAALCCLTFTPAT